jgi:hypothetical protein
VPRVERAPRDVLELFDRRAQLRLLLLDALAELLHPLFGRHAETFPAKRCRLITTIATPSTTRAAIANCTWNRSKRPSSAYDQACDREEPPCERHPDSEHRADRRREQPPAVRGELFHEQIDPPRAATARPKTRSIAVPREGSS